MRIHFFTPQHVTVSAPLEKVYAAMTAFGAGPGAPGQNYSEILERRGHASLVRYTTYVPGRTIVTDEEVICYPPDIVTYRHLTGPLPYVYEVFTAFPVSPTETKVNYIGQYSLSYADWPIFGWLFRTIYVVPTYDAIIRKHLEKVKRISEEG